MEKILLPQLVLSLFPGVDLLGRGFESVGFCVVRGPDLIFGGDVRTFEPVPDRFDGVIGGSPCQDFSAARRSAPSGEGVEMLYHFRRIVLGCKPVWWLLENVARVPDVLIDGYTVQRIDLNARECGSKQNRLRHFQFGNRAGLSISPERVQPNGESVSVLLATMAAKSRRRTFADFCELQGLPRDFDLPSFTLSAKYRAVGNGVHVAAAATMARAILGAVPSEKISLCGCGCGRRIRERQTYATAACRKRMQRRRYRVT